MKTLLKNAKVYPIASPPLLTGDVLVEDGKIALVGKNLVTGSDAKIIDCDQCYLFPGFIDVHTHLGLYDEGTGWAGNDANETIEAMSPHIRAIDGVYPLDPAFSDAVKYGITTVHVMPGSANVVGGTTSVIKTCGKNIQKMLIQETAGLKIAFGENPKRIHSQGNKDSITRMGIMGMLREAFYEAKNTDQPDSLRMAPLVKALKREIPVRIHAHRADDIISAIRFAEEFRLDLRIEHCTEGHLIANELAGQKLKVCVGPTLTRKSKVELKNKHWRTYRELTEHGIEVSITTDHPYTPIQYLNVCAAIAVREGLSEQKALEGITLLAAKNLRIDEKLGSISAGKDADLVLWSHHPFHFFAKPKWTMIDGNFVFTDS
ncbi:amidohydrolase [Bacillus canaveralius]|uniref:Amidohydrolase n=1 Tax=Bacillus canaveralius TaxID=1403243 RepID=A0A2N5GIX7_9BACI|nr:MULTISPECIES: amidohydrolase [Bacillus]PLR81016.1 amidohydrolase [Bacillus canaveralius]PLR83431.1 amidohydrolase [Bacillus sp. V33-4]PLR99008.1 amidohydrolase [Bacillus canaveralius]RSK51791.1 amidohydrolase [Bacillus canaveralius]